MRRAWLDPGMQWKLRGESLQSLHALESDGAIIASLGVHMGVTELERVRSHVGIARRLGLPATLSLMEWEQTIADFSGLCAYCLHRPFSIMEHFLPENEAGTHVNNCIPACETCNKRKRDYTGERLISMFDLETIERIKVYLANRDPTPDGALYIRRARDVLSKPMMPIPSDPFQLLSEIERELKRDRGTILRRIKFLGIKVRKFRFDQRAFIATSDAELLRKLYGRSHD